MAHIKTSTWDIELYIKNKVSETKQNRNHVRNGKMDSDVIRHEHGKDLCLQSWRLSADPETIKRVQNLVGRSWGKVNAV